MSADQQSSGPIQPSCPCSKFVSILRYLALSVPFRFCPKNIFISSTLFETLQHELIVLVTDMPSRENIRMPTYFHVDVRRVYRNPFLPPIKIKKLRKFIAILVNRDDNIWTSQIPIDVILPVQRSKRLPP